MGSKTIIAIIVVIIVVVVLAIALLIRGFQAPRAARQAENKAEEVTTQKRLVSIVDINNDPLVYESLNVETEAEISDWVTKKVFVLSVPTGGGLLTGTRTEQILVINDKDFRLLPEIIPNELGLGETANVNVKGRVRFIDRATLEDLLSFPLNNALLLRDDYDLSDWENGSVIILKSVTKI